MSIRFPQVTHRHLRIEFRRFSQVTHRHLRIELRISHPYAGGIKPPVRRNQASGLERVACGGDERPVGSVGSVSVRELYCEREGDQIMIHVSLHARRLVATAPDFRADTDRSAGDCPCPATVLVGRACGSCAPIRRHWAFQDTLYSVLPPTRYVKSEM